MTPPSPIRVLIVEDSPDDADLLLRELKRSGYAAEHLRVETAEAMKRALAERPWDLVVSDYSMPTFNAPAALQVLKSSGLDLPFIIVSGTIGEDIAVDALKAGAHDFLVKGRLARLAPAIQREMREVEARRRQREAESARREAEARFGAIMETATDAVVSANSAGVIAYVNPAAERTFGYGADEAVGLPLSQLMPERADNGHGPGVAHFLREGPPGQGHTIELIGRRKDGTEFPIDLSLGWWMAGGEHYVAGIIRDITDRKKVEAQLIVADRMVAVGTLASGVAHEINNPLASVIANLDMAIRDLNVLGRVVGGSGLIDEIREELSDAREGADRVRFIVRDLKVFSRGEDERSGPVDLERVLDSTIRMAWNEIRHRARVVKDYSPVPHVEGSESRLGQAFLNIVVNAAQAIPEGHVDDNVIRVTTRAVGAWVVIEIADTGPGIAPEVMSRLFTPFVTTKPVGVGTGLGLSICHRIITGFGGRIEVESTGAGTLFRISLRAAEADTEETAEAPPPVVPLAARRGKILVVDDERLITRVVARAVGEEHQVTGFERARLALATIVAGERYDVILCDLMMPEMSGMDFYQELMRVDPKQAAAVIFLTGGAFTPLARDFLDQTPNLRIDKPFDLVQLRVIVNDRIR